MGQLCWSLSIKPCPGYLQGMCNCSGEARCRHRKDLGNHTRLNWMWRNHQNFYRQEMLWTVIRGESWALEEVDPDMAVTNQRSLSTWNKRGRNSTTKFPELGKYFSGKWIHCHHCDPARQATCFLWAPFRGTFGRTGSPPSPPSVTVKKMFSTS